MFKSFQTKLVILFALLFVLVQALIYSSVYIATKNNLEKQADAQLIYSSTVFNQAMKTKIESWLGEANIYSTDYGFRSAVTTDDQATIMSALENLSSRVGASRAMIFSTDYDVLAEISDDGTSAAQKDIFKKLIDTADDAGESYSFIKISDNVYQFTIVPVLAPIPVAWVAIGDKLDQPALIELKKTLPDGIDITLTEKNYDGKLISLQSTLAKHIASDVTHQVALVESRGEIDLHEALDDHYMAQRSELPSSIGESPISILLTYSLDAAYSPYRPLAYILLALAILGLVSLIMGSITVAKTVSKPLELLARAARLIQIGRYEKVTAIKQKDEIGQLADHFNQMIIGIQDREEKIMYQAEHDLETGLPNRNNVDKYLQILFNNQADTGQTFSVLQISIDSFDEVRNTLGYDTARELLRKIGIRLLQKANSNNFVARLSSANFCFVFEGGNSINSFSLAREIMAIFDDPVMVHNFTIDTNVSIGISCSPEHAQTADLLLQRASIATLHAKDDMNRICIYDKKIDGYDADRLSLMGDFRKSLEEGDVKFYYQPKIDVKFGYITHVEALVRWIHPERGFIPPDDFITMAEQTGHIHHLTLWGLDAAIAQCREWITKNIDLKMAINLSARDLSNRKLPEIIIKLLEKYSVPRTRLVLEVTENAIMQDPELALGVLNDLYQHGLLLSIDDYGTGYSSMSYLKKLPVKELKIDKSFVLELAKNKEDEILVRSTIDLGHNLGLKVTAEGVEDEESMEILRQLGCDLVQGFFISKPLPIADLYDFIENSPYGLNKEKHKIKKASHADSPGSMIKSIERRLSNI
ncbi:MAG: EAL domain-containing protein [Kordiimonadaceae bacterium]|nr:EAL domain-containing protein [Kordiimonadaceae bacterium]